MRSSMFVPAAVFAQSALGFSLGARITSTNTVENANITNFSVTIRGSVVVGETFILRPQYVACRAEQIFTLPAWLPATKCNDTSYSFALGRDENRGWVVWVNHTLPQATLLSGSASVPCTGPIPVFCEQVGLNRPITLT